ncbi:alpha/beta fold hydrolase [Micromonospora sp. U21]|uniref:alpha/beta fold hydrolase n=1 Tax=Micromonospora sp. U21 TaxID=2824899 RepID=UPI001B36FEB9|nr:alpha/beta fold hydrolase [Micromonospora sp. U21]MBQ0902204.1 alpha/beta fold hydrolase [Micromonospora sp. U21]
MPYTFEQDIDDLAVVLEHTGSGNVVGHSSGGFIALQAALRLPINRLALYDAAVSIDGGFPAAWLDAAQEALRAGDTARAPAYADRPDDGRPAADDPGRVTTPSTGPTPGSSTRSPRSSRPR